MLRALPQIHLPVGLRLGRIRPSAEYSRHGKIHLLLAMEGSRTKMGDQICLKEPLDLICSLVEGALRL